MFIVPEIKILSKEITKLRHLYLIVLKETILEDQQDKKKKHNPSIAQKLDNCYEKKAEQLYEKVKILEGLEQNQSQVQQRNHIDDKINHMFIIDGISDFQHCKQKGMIDKEWQQGSNKLKIMEVKNRFRLHSYKDLNKKLIGNQQYVKDNQKQMIKYKERIKLNDDTYERIQGEINTENYLNVMGPRVPKYAISTSKPKEVKQLQYFHADYSKNEEAKPDKYQIIMERKQQEKQILPIIKIHSNNTILQEDMGKLQHMRSLQRNPIGNQDKLPKDFEYKYAGAKLLSKNIKKQIETWNTKQQPDPNDISKQNGVSV